MGLVTDNQTFLHLLVAPDRLEGFEVELMSLPVSVKWCFTYNLTGTTLSTSDKFHGVYKYKFRIYKFHKNMQCCWENKDQTHEYYHQILIFYITDSVQIALY